jgi:two-component system, OmpR family, sensor kinase
MKTRSWQRWWGGIRGRLLAGFAMLFVLALGTSATLTAFQVNDYIFDRSVRKLQEDARRVGTLAADSPQTVNADQFDTVFGPPLGMVGLDQRGAVLFGIGEGAGREADIVRLTRSAAQYDVVVTEDDVAAVRLKTPGMRISPVDDRAVDVAELILVNNTDIDRAVILDFVRTQATVAGVSLIVLIVLAMIVLQIGLRPLSEMAEAADAIAEGSREERLSVSKHNSETDVLAAAVNRAFDAQARTEARARTFAADASHELRTPLATISGWLELYRQGGLGGDDVDVAVARIEDEVARIRLLVEELGLLARLDSGRPLDHEPFDLARLAESVVEDSHIIYSGLDISLDAPDTLPLIGDAPRLQQVLRNLVGNAVQHTPPGTQVRLKLCRDGDEARIDVSDNGQGIPAADIPRLFDRFWRAEASRSRDYGGSGLGLAIVQAIVRAHGGQVTVKSEVGQGTTVSLHLPAQ